MKKLVLTSFEHENAAGKYADVRLVAVDCSPSDTEEQVHNKAIDVFKRWFEKHYPENKWVSIVAQPTISEETIQNMEKPARSLKRSGIYLIAEERRKVLASGIAIQHDVKNNPDEQLIIAAIALLNTDRTTYQETVGREAYILENMPSGWNEEICIKMAKKPYFDRLVIAGQLIASEIDRLQFEEGNVISEQSHREAHNEMFEEVSRPVMKYLAENWHPHASVIITPTNAELVTGELTTGPIHDYIRD